MVRTDGRYDLQLIFIRRVKTNPQQHCVRGACEEVSQTNSLNLLELPDPMKIPLLQHCEGPCGKANADSEDARKIYSPGQPLAKQFQTAIKLYSRADEILTPDNLVDATVSQTLSLSYSLPTSSMSDSSPNEPHYTNMGPILAGRKTWVFANKLALFLGYTAKWKRARDAGVDAAGIFYTNLTMIFISLYGWHFNRWLDKAIGVADAATWQNIRQETDLSREEAEKRREYFEELRKVRVHVIAVAQLLISLQ